MNGLEYQENFIPIDLGANSEEFRRYSSFSTNEIQNWP
jgi:hypothetical protein